VIGAGTGGCAAVYQLMASNADIEVTLIEAGPDHGPFDEHRWPAELLDTRSIPTTHDWGLFGEAADGRRYPVERAKVMGGCSSHNGCSAVRGTRQDFLDWENATAGGFSSAQLAHDFEAIEALLRVRPLEAGELSPYQSAIREAAVAKGWPESADINDLDEAEGVSACPVNKRGAVRWNAAFAFVDPWRNDERLRILAGAQVEKLSVAGHAVTGVTVKQGWTRTQLPADTVVLAAGAYLTPIVLQRSGIGDPQVIEASGLRCVHRLDGVGKNLQDHPCVVLHYAGSPELVHAMRRHQDSRLLFEEGVIIKCTSSTAIERFDLHFFPVSASTGREEQPWDWALHIGLMRERSRGTVLLAQGGGGERFSIVHRHFTDPQGADLRTMIDAVALARDLMSSADLARQIGTEVSPGASVVQADLSAWIVASHVHYWHPVGTCAMGTDPRRGAVCDGRGAVFGIDNLFISDASLMPTITSNNVNLPTALLGWRVGREVASRCT
jgi:choline dehydrogenase